MANTFRLVLLALLWLPYVLWGQAPETFELAGIKVTGCVQTSPVTVSQMSGLQVGDKIQLPGTAIPHAMQRLLQQRLFEDIQIEKVRSEADLLWLEIKLSEAPQVKAWRIAGLKKNKTEVWSSWLEDQYPYGTAWLPAQESQLQAALARRLEEEGYATEAAEVYMQHDRSDNSVRLFLEFSDLKRRKLSKIHWQGNQLFTSKQLNRLLGEGLLKRPVFTKKWREDARTQLLMAYREEGYLDAVVTLDSTSFVEEQWHWFLRIEEGLPYTIGEISWEGADRYSPVFLQEILGIETGDPYRPDELERRLHFDPEGGDISSLYMDRGHLFFQAETMVTSLRGQTVDISIRLMEGPVAIVGAVNIIGNDRTNDHVIRRALRTQPGEPFSRADVLRSQRALINMGYFNPENLGVSTDVDPESKTVDITYELVETRNDKFEISASLNPGSGESGTGIIGTLGFTFNNFSLRQLLDGNLKGAHGDGQQLSIRAQSSGLAFQAYNLNFQEPWLMGKPQSLGFSLFHQRFASQDSLGWNNTLAVSGGSLNWGRRLSWGDMGGWSLSGELGYQYIQLDNFLSIDLDDGSQLRTGNFNNLYSKVELAYQNVDDPFFPHKGRRVRLSGQWTPPWETRYSAEGTETFDRLSYHKYRISAEQFLPLGKKLVLRTSAKAGGLFNYQSTQSTPPFERFELGGNGMTGSQQAAFVGNDLLSLRGYDPDEIAGSANGGGAAFAKFTAELRYPLFNSGAARAYVLGFAEAGNAWKQVNDFSLGDLNRSAGLGIRLQLPMFGTIGVDYGIGFDQLDYNRKDWQKSGRLNLIFGWEPE